MLLCLVTVISATNNQLYTYDDNLIGVILLTKVETSTRLRCGFRCMELNGAGFLYNYLTRECKFFKETLKQQSISQQSSGIYGKPHECGIIPELFDFRESYKIEHLFKGNTSLSRYRCQSFDDPVPISRCDQIWTKACTAKDIFNSNDPVYEGRISCTVKGVTCQRWDNSSPHVPYYYINRSDLQNWCQMESSSRPWCYTMDPGMIWDYCPVDEVSCSEPPPVSIPGTSVTIEWPYNYAISAARYRCSSLADIKPAPSCPVSRCLPGGSWTTANVSCSDKECFDHSKETYTGSVTCTQTGLACQRWDITYPHILHIFKGRSDLGNRCVLGISKRPWCYTVNPAVVWEFCPVDECA